MADGLTMEHIQTEAAAKQRAFESHDAEASTSGRGTVTGTPGLRVLSRVCLQALLPCYCSVSDHTSSRDNFLL